MSIRTFRSLCSSIFAFALRPPGDLCDRLTAESAACSHPSLQPFALRYALTNSIANISGRACLYA